MPGPLVGCREDPQVSPTPLSPGYLIIHVMQSLCGLMIMYGLVLPVTHHRGLEMLRRLGLGM